MSWRDLLRCVEPEQVRGVDGLPSALEPGAMFLAPFSLANLARAEEHYVGRGYVLQAVPWVVSAAPYHATRPEGAPPYETLGGFLVASGEQSFLQQMMDGFSPGRAMALTPCFRREEYDRTHLPYFLKLELIRTDEVSLVSLEEVVSDALDFHSSLLDVRIEVTPEGSLDILSVCSGLELGSYGIRRASWEDRVLSWVYGTGCAEPRLTQALG